MPTIKIKTVHIDKLKVLGCYDAWLSNVKAQFKGSRTGGGCRLDIWYFADWWAFIDWSFMWVDTPEEHDFWEIIQSL